jgi:hypothetical protein
MASDRDPDDLIGRSRRLAAASQELAREAQAHGESAARSLVHAEQHLDRIRHLLQQRLKHHPPDSPRQ